jgi:hypothetical protein
MNIVKPVSILASAFAVATLGLNATAPNVLAADSTDVYVTNICNKNMTLWYEMISGKTVQRLETVSIAPNERKFVKSTPYSVFRYYAKTWDGSYEWDGSGRVYTIDGRQIRMREFNLNDVANTLTLRLPCSNL